MPYEDAEKATVSSVSKSDIDYVNNRIDRVNERIDKLNKKVALVLAVMIDKGMIGENLAKKIEESKGDDSDLIDWLMEEVKKI